MKRKARFKVDEVVRRRKFKGAAKSYARVVEVVYFTDQDFRYKLHDDSYNDPLWIEEWLVKLTKRERCQ